MTKDRKWARACLLSFFLFVVVAPSWGATGTAAPEDEYKQLIRVDQDIHPLGAHPFGENIGLYDGSLSFRQVDVSLSGTGPLLQLAREFHIRGRYGLNTSGQDGSFGDWDLSLPRLQTLSIKRGFANDSQGNVVTVRGWDVSTPNGSDFTKRCSHFNSPPIVVMQSGDPALMPWEPGSWWKGYHLIIPGHGSQDLLSNNGTYSSKTTYPVVTKDHWRFQCLSSVANPSTNPDTNGDGQVNTDDLPYPTGEGFLGIAPDGTKYWFNELVYKDADGMSRPLYSDPVVSADPEKRLWKRASKTLESILSLASGSSRAEATTTSDGIYRSEAVLLVTKIEDRFGNTLTYNYDSAGHLTDITASDGRKLTLQYDSSNPDRIVSVTAQPSSGSPRVWTYTYGTGLTRVTLPDGSHWQYDLSALDSAYMAKGDSSSCEALGYDSTQASSTGSITHPSGLTGTFTVKPMRHGQWNGAASCLDMQNGLSDTPGSHVTIPYGWYGFTITSRTVSGAGVPSATWHYTYQAANQTWSNHSCTGSCSPTTWTDVERPDGSTVRRTFDNSFASATESKLLRTDHYAGGVSGTPARSEVSAYASPDTSPFPSSVGGVLQGDVNYDQITSYTPLQRRDIIQNGDTYTWTAEAYNAYAQVTKEKRSNSIAGQSSDERQTSYYNDTNLWVLGLPLQIDDLSTGETISRNVYDTSNDTLKSRYRFGQKVMDYTFNSAGQLASFTDGDGNTTSLSDYKRGIPQQIDYADGTTQSLSVDDFGQIGSITDQAGHTTSYAYDDVGRVTRIDYPSGGSVAWAPKTFTYSYITSAERGIGADHWRRTVQTGSAQQVTWFDAELRPVLSESYDSASSAPHTSSAIAYDWRGLKTFVSYPAAGSPSVSAFVSGTHNTYDALGRVTQVVQDAESTYGTLTSTTAYLSGARKQVTDPEGHVTTTSYQVFDQPTYDAVTKVQAPESITQTIARNLYGDPTEITQSGGGDSVSKYLYYDAYHRLCRTTEPESGSTVVDYDAAGNIAWSAAGQAITGTDCGRTQVAAGDKTVRSYDAMNRVLSIDYPAGTEDTVYTYDDLGNVHTAVSGIATWTYAYNNRNVLKSETLGVDGYSWPLSYSHDANGSLKRITYPDGKVLDYAPDALGRPSKAGAQATSVSYLPDGSVESFTLGNGAQYLAQKNGRHLLSNLTYAKSGGALVYSQDMAYDKNANLTTTTDLVPSGTRTKSFGYDALNRLTSAEADDLWGTETYTYDTLNNITSMSSDGLVRTYHYDANNLLTDITTASGTLHSYAYDAQGNTTTRDSDTLVFDKANRLTQVVGKDTYAYDASGRRVKKTPDGGTATYYAYSSAGQLMWEYDQATQQNTDYVYLGKKMLAKVQRSPGDPLLNPPSISFDANPNDGNYTVSWTGETGVSYDLQEKVGSGSWSTVYSGSNQSKSFSGRTGGSYYYRARECGDECGDWSDPSLLGVSPQQPTVTVPGTLQSGAFTVSWSKPAGTSTFDVEEQINGGSWTRIVDHVDQTSISRPATANGSYVYRVEANSTYGTRGWKTSDTVTVLHPPSTAPTVTVPAISGTGDYTASWNSVSTADSYNLQQQVDGGSWSTVYSGSAMSTPLTGGVNRSTYGYRAQACNASGCGPWGSVSSVQVVYPPNAPPNVQVVVQGSSKITYEKAEWDAVNYADRYEVKIDSSSTIVYSGTDTMYTIESTVPPDVPVPHTPYVRACNIGGCSRWSSLPPTVPSLTVPSTNHTGSYTASWDSVSSATSYTLQEEPSGGSWSTVYSGSGTSATLSGHANGTYYYRLQACDIDGCSAWSAVQSVDVSLPPPTPSSISVPATSSGPITISWSSSSTATSYTLQAQYNGGSWNNFHTGTGTSYSYTATASGNHKFRVKACNAAGCSGYKTSGNVDVTLPPNVPTLNVPSTSETGSYSINWSSLSTATSYTLQQQANGGSWSTVYSGSGTSKSFSGMTNGTTFGYRVRACNSGGCGSWSTTKSVMVRRKPTNVTVVYDGSYKITYETAKWDALSNVSHYDVKLDSTSNGTVYSGTATSYRIASSVPPDFPPAHTAYVRACYANGCSSWVKSQ